MGIEMLKNQTITNIVIDKNYEDKIIFQTNTDTFIMEHFQECCECVEIEEIIGDMDDLIGVPILTAEERSNYGEINYGTYTYTFYEIRTIKGSVTIRWHGSSNGYYSEEVSFYRKEK